MRFVLVPLWRQC